MTKELEALRDFWNPVVKQIVSNLNTMTDTKGHNRNASGVTGQEIAAKTFGTQNGHKFVEETIEAYIIELVFPSYALFIDEGVKGWQNTAKTTGRFSFKRNGRAIPRTAMRSFMMNRRGIGEPRNAEGKRTKPKNIEDIRNQIAYAIGASIKKEGVDMVPFISSVINDELIAKYKKFLSDVVGQRIKEEIVLNFNQDKETIKV